MGLDRRAGGPADGGRIAAVILVVVGEQDALDGRFFEHFQQEALHVALTRIDQDPVDVIAVNAHQGRAKRAVPELKGLNRSEATAGNDVHGDTGILMGVVRQVSVGKNIFCISLAL
jgi:hypothetical protein